MRLLSTKILRFAKKIKAIEYLGGKCQICGNDNWYHLEFHHLKDKKYDLSEIREYRWSVLQDEINVKNVVMINLNKRNNKRNN
jgi:hypothetical protein